MLTGKIILVTGASSGIGRAMAKFFSSQGASVILVARSKEKLDMLADELGKSAYVVPSDLSVLDNVKKVFLYCKENSLKLDGIVHCAGMTMSVPIRANDNQRMEELMRVNVGAFAEICKYASSKRYTNDGASVIAMSSTASFRGDKGLGIYSASKAAINTLVKSVAMELATRRIRVNAIAPSMVRTEMYYETLKDIPEMERIVLESQPLGLIEPEYIAYLAAFLLSEQSRYITGTVVVVGAGNVF